MPLRVLVVALVRSDTVSRARKRQKDTLAKQSTANRRMKGTKRKSDGRKETCRTAMRFRVSVASLDHRNLPPVVSWRAGRQIKFVIVVCEECEKRWNIKTFVLEGCSRLPADLWRSRIMLDRASIRAIERCSESEFAPVCEIRESLFTFHNFTSLNT